MVDLCRSARPVLPDPLIRGGGPHTDVWAHYDLSPQPADWPSGAGIGAGPITSPSTRALLSD